jgi:thiol-disulfide isomerase/thioredoxin
MLRTSFAALLLAVAGAASSAHGAQPTPAASAPASSQQAQPAREYDLMVGDRAPALSIDKWVKGGPVTGYEKGKVYVVEFWATWCGPCIAAMPHLAELQKKHADAGLTVIGVTSRDSRNTLDAVERMVQDKADVMTYTVAWDEDRETWNAFMRAAGQGGIPCSFIVNQEGRIAYIGHPLAMDATLEQVVAGTHDIEKAARDYARQIINQEKLRPLRARLHRAIMQQDWDGAMTVTDEIEALDPELGPQLAYQRFGILLSKGDYDRAYIFARQALEGPAAESADLLNRMAWAIVDPEGTVQTKDLDVALTAAQKAVELTRNANHAYLDTLAMVYHLRGEHDKAVETQTRALELHPDDAELKAHMDLFTAARDKAQRGG